MKLKLRENMYIRNCYGRIAKIEYIEDNIAYCDNWLYQSYGDHITFINLDDEEDIDEITKASYNIIDLIEVGDYVNGLPVRFVEESRVDIGQAEDYFWLKNQHIKSIVTHEQMEQMEYKV